MGAGLHAQAARAGREAVRPGGGRAEQPDPVSDGDAGDQAEQLRDADALAVGADPGEAVPDRRERAGAGAIPAAGRPLLQPDDQHPGLVHRRPGGGGGEHDVRHDDVAHLHRRPALGAGGAVHHFCPLSAGREDQPGAAGRDPRAGG